MSKEQQAQAQPQVAIPLPKGKKNAVQLGCICMMLSVAMYGLVFATLTSPILKSVDAMGYVDKKICVAEKQRIFFYTLGNLFPYGGNGLWNNSW